MLKLQSKHFKRLHDDHGEEEGDKNSVVMGVNRIYLYGEVNKEKASQLVSVLMEIADATDKEDELDSAPAKDTGAGDGAKSAENMEPEERDPKEIEILISSPGGDVLDMFAIFDAIRYCKEKGFVIKTRGMGQVMSAGILLMAAGTPGHRILGKNCRLMIHSVTAGTIGSLHDMLNDLEEIVHLQKEYKRVLIELTGGKQKEIDKIFKKKSNYYFSAEEAISLGIADSTF